MKLTFMPFFVRACVDALRDFPMVNASRGRHERRFARRDQYRYCRGARLGPDRSRAQENPEEKNFLGLQRGINDLAERARTKKLKPEEVQESTFSITNPGTFGGLMGLP